MLTIIYVAMIAIPTIAAVYRLLFVRRIGDEPSCRSCGYNLNGTTLLRCPECGSDISGTGVARGKPVLHPRYRIIAILAFLVFCTVAAVVAVVMGRTQ